MLVFLLGLQRLRRLRRLWRLWREVNLRALTSLLEIEHCVQRSKGILWVNADSLVCALFEHAEFFADLLGNLHLVKQFLSDYLQVKQGGEVFFQIARSCSVILSRTAAGWMRHFKSI